jgi:hypothetical protein
VPCVHLPHYAQEPINFGGPGRDAQLACGGSNRIVLMYLQSPSINALTCKVQQGSTATVPPKTGLFRPAKAFELLRRPGG